MKLNMNKENAEFIARHHKGMGATPEAGRKRSDYKWVVIGGMIALYATSIFYIWFLFQEKHITFITTGYLLAIAVVIGGAIYGIYYFFQSQQKRLNLLRDVLEGSRGARLITDGADNAIFYNERFEKLCSGIGAPEYKSLMALFQGNEEAIAHFRLLADQAHRGLTDTIQLYSSDEKHEGWYSVTAQPVADRAGFIHWRIDDITQKHTVDRSVREEREKLIDFTDNAPVGFFSVDENGRFLFANATFARWVGDDLKTLLEQNVLHTYLADPPEKAKPYDVSADGGFRQVVEIRMKGPAGKTFLASINQVVVKEDGGKVRTRAVVNDLTSEREMHKALKASEDRFQRFFEEAPMGIILINRKGLIKDCNSEFASMLGLEQDEIEGQPFERFLMEEEKAAPLAALEQIEGGENMNAPLEMTLQGNEEVELVAHMHGRRFKSGGHTVLHFIDLTTQKELEAQFVQSQKMQGIGQLAGGIAHDFNNLLTAMIGFCDLLLLRHKPGDPSFSDIMQIKQNGNRAANLVRQLLAFSRQQTLRPRVQDVSDILTEVSHLLRRLMGASIEMDIVHGQDLGLVKVDGGQMDQVLINLAVNARDAMQGNGKLIISTENFTNKKPKKVGTEEEMPPGHWILIKVSDTGSGIPKEIIDRVFEPFFTTKDVGEGTGLGLATVYGIVRQTGGYLHLDSKVDKGTTFFIYLPRANETEEDEAEDDIDEVDEQKDLTGTECILLVEDEDAVRMFSQRALGNKGYEVLTADCGESALKVVEKEGLDKINLLITDVVMPNMDGPALAQAIRKDNPQLKIIFMSGYTEDRLKEHMDSRTFFLPKPFSLKQLAAKVKEVFEE